MRAEKSMSTRHQTNVGRMLVTGVDNGAGLAHTRAMTKPASTLDTTAAGTTRSIYSLQVGEYIWHAGAFRRVTAVDGRTVRMGRHVLHSIHASTVEVAAP